MKSENEDVVWGDRGTRRCVVINGGSALQCKATPLT